MRQRLYTREYGHDATQAAVTTQNITAPQGRGPVVGIDFVTENATLANQDDVLITVAINGDEVLKDVSLMYYGSNYQKKDTMQPFDAPEGSTITVQYNNSLAATDVRVRARVTTDYAQRRNG